MHALPTRRAAALAAVLGLVAVWGAIAVRLPSLDEWPGVALTALVLVPLTLSVVWLALPLAGRTGLLPAALVVGAVAVGLDALDLDGLFNTAKLAAYVLFGYWFLTLFDEQLWLVAVVALVIPWADAASVAAGPTRVIVEDRPDVFERVAVAFPLPGDGGFAALGPPDVVFFALFMAAADRFGLRVAATFVCTVALLGLTLALAVAFDVSGLPALPAVSLGFLLPNADLLWRGRRRAAGRGARPPAQR